MGSALLIVLVAGVAGFAFGWAARKDDARRYVEANKRYYATRIAELSAELADAEAEVDRLTQLLQLAPAAPATAQQTVVHVHMPAYPAAAAVPAPQYLEVLPAAQLELDGRVA